MDFETGFEKLDKSARSCMRISGIIGSVIVGGPAIATILFFVWENHRIWAIVALLAVILICLTGIFIAPAVRYERYRYKIDDESIRVREGFLWINEDIVPIERLHKIKISQGPIARIFKLSTVCVTTAGSESEIKFLKDETAEEICEKLKVKINQIIRAERPEKNE